MCCESMEPPCLQYPSASFWNLTCSLSSHTTVVFQEEKLFLDKPEPIWMPASATRSEGKSRWATLVPVLHHQPARREGRTWSKGVTKAFLAPTRSRSALVTPTTSTHYKLYVTVHRGGQRVNEQQVRPSLFAAQIIKSVENGVRGRPPKEGLQNRQDHMDKLFNYRVTQHC